MAAAYRYLYPASEHKGVRAERLYVVRVDNKGFMRLHKASRRKIRREIVLKWELIMIVMKSIQKNMIGSHFMILMNS